MNKVTTFAGLGLALLASAGVWGADCVVEGDAHAARVVAAREVDDQRELSWDNGTRRWSVGWYTGAGSWVGNEFDLATISSYRAVTKIRFYSRSNWPNSQWDGFRLGFFAFQSGVPGSMLWPTGGGGYFFKPSGLQGHVWVECGINWTCPVTRFVAGEEQFYNWPNCDPWAVDNNRTFRGHSWFYYEGRWALLSAVSIEISPYYNLMLRVVVNNETVTVKPTSLGRVKALYY